MSSASSVTTDQTEQTQQEFHFVPARKESLTNTTYLPNFSAQSKFHLENIDISSKNNLKGKYVDYQLKVRWTEDSVDTFNNFSELCPDQAFFQDLEDQVSPFSMVKCDGPCAKLQYADDMWQFGDCDHNICPTCYEFEPNVPLYDGSSGCSNTRCYELQLEIRAIRSRTSSFSSSTDFDSTTPLSNKSYDLSNMAGELLIVKVKAFRKVCKELEEQRREMEMDSMSSLEDLHNTLLKHFSDLEKCKIYYASGHMYKRKDLKELKFVAGDERRLMNLAGKESYLNVIVAYPNVTIKQ